MKSVLKSIIVTIITLEAKLILRKYKPTIIAVTGSVGKTSTKDAIYSLLSGFVHVRKSDKSFNSEIGVPLTIIGCPNAWNSISGWFANIMHGLDVIFSTRESYPKFLVLEIGTDRPGDIRALTKWLNIDVAVINRISEVPVHVEYFKDRAQLVDEKLSLVRALSKNGSLILYGDQAEIRDIMPPAGQKVFRYGFTVGFAVGFATESTTGSATGHDSSAKNDVIGSRYAIKYDGRNGDLPVGFVVDVAADDSTTPITLEFNGVIGIQQAYPFLAAYSVLKALGFDPVANKTKVLEQLRNHKFPPGRMNIIPGIKNSIIIDDTYNASPDATAAGLKVIEEIRSHSPLVQSSVSSSLILKVGNYTSKVRTIVIVGDMMELGQHSVSAHEEVGVMIAKMSPTMLITVGMRASKSADGALAVISGKIPGQTDMKAEDVVSFTDSNQAAREIPHLIREHDVIYIKGSQFIRAERITYALMQDHSKAPFLLVRQDKQWLEKE